LTWGNNLRYLPHGVKGGDGDHAVAGRINQVLREMFDTLYAALGAQNWWPAETELEMMVGAILTQNTNWNNVEKAIENLRNRDLLSVAGLRDIPISLLAEHIRPAGYYNIKAGRLKNLIGLIETEHGGDINAFLSLDADTLRAELLSVRGIGRETADSIILYGAGKPLFVIDTYTYRILARHGIIQEEAGYDELQSLFMDNLPHDVELFKEFHALIVKTGKLYCRKRPLCPPCPLNTMSRV
jgi:endonuclease-3 related protein